MNKYAIVLGSNYSTALGVIRSLGEAGFEVFLYYITSRKQGSKVAAASRYVRGTFERLGRDDAAITRDLIQRYGSYADAVLMPTDDYSSVLISRRQRELSAHFRMPFVDDGKPGVEWLMDKSNQARLASGLGVRTARSWKMEYGDDGYRIPEDVAFPCFIKPLASHSGGKRGMVKLETRDALEHFLQGFRAGGEGVDLLVQEYLDIEEEYSIPGACLGEQVVMSGLLTKRRISRYKPGVTIFGRVDDIARLGAERDKLVALLRSLGYHGLFDMEVFRCADGFYFNELNFRSSSVCHAMTDAGVNTPALLMDHLLGGTGADAAPPVDFGRRFFSEKVACDDAIAGYIPWAELKRLRSQADYCIIHDDRDPAPERVFWRKMLWTAIRRRISGRAKR